MKMYRLISYQLDVHIISNIIPDYPKEYYTTLMQLFEQFSSLTSPMSD